MIQFQALQFSSWEYQSKWIFLHGLTNLRDFELSSIQISYTHPMPLPISRLVLINGQKFATRREKTMPAIGSGIGCPAWCLYTNPGISQSTALNLNPHKSTSILLLFSLRAIKPESLSESSQKKVGSGFKSGSDLVYIQMQASHNQLLWTSIHMNPNPSYFCLAWEP